MDELQESLGKLLEDPAELERLSRMASELLGGGENAAQSETPPMPDLRALLNVSGASGASETQKLLRAMQPFLAPKRQEKLSRALRVTRLASMAQLALGQMKEEDQDEPILREHGPA